MAETQTTRLSRRWLLKISIFLIGLPLFGALGLYDGLIKYPRRGELDASVRLSRFLDENPVFTKVETPRETFAQLKERQDEGARGLSDEESALLEFLASLDRLWRLDAKTLELPIADAEGRPETWDISRGEAFVTAAGERKYELVSETRSALRAHWDTAKKPAPLDSKFDIAFQWALVVVCFGLWPWPIWLVVKAMRTRYRWDANEQRLTLPDASSFTPDEIAEFDKTRWHKFYVTVHLKDGRAMTFDLLRHEPLEEWIKQMERTRFPEAAAPSDEAGEQVAAPAEARREEAETK
jgi:hypothetical protein